MSQLVARVVGRANIEQARYPHRRRGQALMNALYEQSQVIYMAVHNTEADCFYNDNNIQTFFQKVSEYG